MTNEWVMPPRNTTEDTRLAWLKEAVREGQAFLQNQFAYGDIEKGKRIIAGLEEQEIPSTLSHVSVNMEKRLIRDIVSTMSNLRPLWGYSTDNQELVEEGVVLNKLLLSWYQTTFADRQIKKVLQYAALGQGYIGPDWKSDFWTTGRGDIVLKVWGPDQVIPIQLPNDKDLQRAYAVTLLEPVPINLARAMFPTMANKLIPDRQAPTGVRAAINKVSSILSPVLNMLGANSRAKQAMNTVFPEIDIYQTYILDLSVNEGPDPIVMGEPGTSWNYIVPVLGSEIQDGVNGLGQPIFRKATPDDCRIYPFRRLITWCSSGILRDDTSYWWHGKVPAVPFRIDGWAWEFLGFSITRDLDPLNQSNNKLRRAMDDSANARLRPPLQYDDRNISQSTMEAFDTRIPGGAIGVDMSISSDKPIKPVLDPTYYDVQQWIPNLITSNEETMKYLCGVNDFSAIAKARQLPSSDTVEKIMEMAGPIVTDVSREMESSLGQLGEMIKCMFFQWYTAERRLQIIGSDGLDTKDVDYFSPAQLIPSHLPNEDKNQPPKSTVIQRARKYMNSFFFKITPNSLHQITQLSRKLLYIQLQKAGLPIDPWTMAEVMDIPNFGPPPEGAKTVMEKWIAFEREKGELQAHIQAQAMIIAAAAQAKLMMMGGGGIPGGPGPGGPPPGGGGGLPQPSHSPALGDHGPGRPANISGHPELKQKDNGTRSTIQG